MEIINCQNPNKVKYFDLFDYISNIRINSSVLEHMEDTNIKFDRYMKKLKSYNQNSVAHMWLIETAEELASSSGIEKHYISPQEYLKKDLYFDTLKISHQKIHEIRNFVMNDGTVVDSYRKTPVRVSYFDKEGVEHIYWHGAEAEDINMFMNRFLDVYRSKDLSIISSNPFLKSALVELLFIRIHPYTDGNGRTARVLYNMKFTDLVNKIYEMDLKLCPLNMSASILLNQLSYVKILDNIYFDTEHDNNEYMNKWFDFILNMADEQLYYLSTKAEELELTYELYRNDEDAFDKMLDKILNTIRGMNIDEIHQYREKTLGTLIN